VVVPWFVNEARYDANAMTVKTAATLLIATVVAIISAMSLYGALAHGYTVSRAGFILPAAANPFSYFFGVGMYAFGTFALPYGILLYFRALRKEKRKAAEVEAIQEKIRQVHREHPG
jgi:hypothetical protein